MASETNKEFKQFKIKTTVVQEYVDERIVLAESEEAAAKGEVYRPDGERLGYVTGGINMVCGNWEAIKVDGVKYGGLKNLKQKVEINEVSE